MPLRELRCLNCGKEFEKVMKWEEENPDCEDCDGPTDKLISRSSFRLEGDGWGNQGYQKKD